MESNSTSPRDIRRDALREVECWLTGEFRRSPMLPVIVLDSDIQQAVIREQVYRAMFDYLFHWAIQTQNYLLRHEELCVSLIKVAARYDKVKFFQSNTIMPR